MSEPHALSPFAAIRSLGEGGHEYWSARALMTVLGYAKWQRFREVIQRAVVACTNSSQDAPDHFTATGKMVIVGSGARRRVEDYQLSRYACYLIIQNADPEKEIVALGQTYFAVQTRRQELSDSAVLDRLTEDQKRLVLRDEVADHNTRLAAAAHDAGVITARAFAIFQDHGYAGLYGGLRANDIHTRKGLRRSQQILDHMGSAELAANLFRATQTEQKLARDATTTCAAANATHAEVGRVVRATIAQLGGTMPEDLPTPEKSVQQLQREALTNLAQSPQLPLFTDDGGDHQ